MQIGQLMSAMALTLGPAVTGQVQAPPASSSLGDGLKRRTASKPQSERRIGSLRPSSEPERSALGLTPLSTSREWQLRLRHRSAGRARLQLPVLRRAPELAERLSAALKVDPLIHAVRLNPRCASLVVHHALDHCSDADLTAAFARRLEPLSLAWHVSQVQSVAKRIEPYWVLGSASALGSTSAAEKADQRRQKATAQKPIAAKEHRLTRFRRPGLTWALADVPIRQGTLARDRLPRSRQRPPSVARSLRLSRRSSRRPSCWLCALHRRFMRWMARLSLRCWWQGR